MIKCAHPCKEISCPVFKTCSFWNFTNYNDYRLCQAKPGITHYALIQCKLTRHSSSYMFSFKFFFKESSGPSFEIKMTTPPRKLRHTAKAPLTVFRNVILRLYEVFWCFAKFYNFFVIFGGQTDRQTDRPTDLGIKAPSRSLKMPQSGVGSMQGSSEECLPIKGHTRGGDAPTM